MRVFFSILSIAYIAGIFLWADSPMVSDLASFNPYSLLHIPLYGILTVLLNFSFFPLKFKSKVPNDPNVKNQIKPNMPCPNNPMTKLPNNLITKGLTLRRNNAINHTNQINQINQRNYFIVGLVALMIGIADEIHQSFIPTRDASIIDVFLDFIGISLALFLLSKYKKRFQ